MKKIFSYIVIGAMLVYVGGLGAANAQDRPPQDGPECRPTRNHPCPPPPPPPPPPPSHRPPPPSPDNENGPPPPPPDQFPQR